ncbi:aminotransferase class I/II-fold pyridoxal phosphate-dependent enzyme [Ensifer sp. SL37]|uniref:aminotransferase class I/II-fold pyridoxal phosphate-dependent enzyme n=1 Tax=Ensifer sp. SL37 TaxID=2995137 RepID=UPI002276235F|nr:aminotransferase class I/II-fold pyridoxal phosphate-dependent enzyme [Ensifer sp. SL37]MCY1740614.1 aminotransferase class I/II-fold pyridoxal phosphate-dependent enzyme [Ensifer sp. SL37]
MHTDFVAGTDQTLRRNTAALIQSSDECFRAAQAAGLVGISAYPNQGRGVELHSANDAGRNIVDFVRCSYLGLDNHPRIVAGAVEALERYGNLHWSCARTRLNLKIAFDLEDALSKLFDARVIVYSTVLAANMGALPLLASGHLTNREKPIVVFDKLAHATLAFHKATVALETEVLTIAHNDIEALERVCRTGKKVAYVCDGVYSMGGSAPIRKLQDLQSRYGMFLYIDDAHGISIFGDRGEGFARSQVDGPLGDSTIIAASLGKGFGASGGLLMLGTERQEELFRRYAIAHAFSASPNVAALGAAMASVAIHESSELGIRQRRSIRATSFLAIAPMLAPPAADIKNAQMAKQCIQRWLGKIGQVVKWNFWLRAARVP